MDAKLERQNILADLHAKLDVHFAQLAAKRKTSGDRAPIFALEHSLDPSGIAALQTCVRAHISRLPPNRNHYLPWIVYAAEIGYRYAGDEYWETFEAETPGWREFGDREWIRERFRQFQKTYSGAVPTGHWAEHFSIICWPITHAILPTDLQRQLAQLLYDLRGHFTSDLLKSSEKLGELVQSRSWHATSRFRNFAQQHSLVGQISTALLLQEKDRAIDLILPTTLQRIVSDLEQERRAREWLRGARKTATERVTVRGLGNQSRTFLHDISSEKEARREVRELGIEPRLVLAPASNTAESWDLLLEIPDLSGLVIRLPESQEILGNTRCVVAGSSGRPLARGRLLHGATRIQLERWPRHDEPLLRFEKTLPTLEYLLNTECLLRPSETRLFRVCSDGLAYEQAAHRVRAGERYILVSDSKIDQAAGQPLIINCSGVTSVLIDVPCAIDEQLRTSLRKIGIRTGRVIEAWPAGLSALEWDGDGRSAWPSSEKPVFAIRSDHQLDQIEITVANHKELSLDVANIPAGEIVFIELPVLDTGLYELQITARRTEMEYQDSGSELSLTVQVRDELPNQTNSSARAPIYVQVDPPAPTLEDFWENRAQVVVSGPRGRKLNCLVRLMSGNSGESLAKLQLPPLDLPVSDAQWREHFERHCRDHKAVNNFYDLAKACEITFSADELGSFTLRCDRDFTPLRWALKRTREQTFLALIDDSGSKEQAIIFRSTFESPVHEERLPPESSFQVPPAGGLYIAKSNSFSCSIVVPPRVTGLSDLACHPSIDVTERTSNGARRICAMMERWRSARTTGDVLSRTRQRQVLEAFHRRLLSILCGECWVEREERAQRNVHSLSGAISTKPYETGLGVVLERDTKKYAEMSIDARVSHFGELARTFLRIPLSSSITPPRQSRFLPASTRHQYWLAEFALRMASHPCEGRAWAQGQFEKGVLELLSKPTLMRAARFLVLCVNNAHTAESEGTPWTW